MHDPVQDYTQSVSFLPGTSHIIDINGMTPGYYLLQAESGGKTACRKFITE